MESKKNKSIILIKVSIIILAFRLFWIQEQYKI